MGYYPDPMNAIYASRWLRTTPAHVKIYLYNGWLRGNYNNSAEKCRITKRNLRDFVDKYPHRPAGGGGGIEKPTPNYAKLIWGVEESARILQREGYVDEHDYIVLVYLTWVMKLERQERVDYWVSVPDCPEWSKIVWALEAGARRLQNEGYTVEHDYIINRLVSHAIFKRDREMAMA